jgi:4-aminobutyrate aminotransferase
MSALSPSVGEPQAVRQLLERDSGIIAGVEKLRFFPLAVIGGKGSHLIEAGGRALLDLSASWTAAGLGYGHPAIVEAVCAGIQNPAGGSGLSAISEAAVTLAEQLSADLQEVGGSNRRVYLGNSGTDANDVALRACRRATGRERIVAFKGGYHGGLGLAMGVSHIFAAAGVPADPNVTFLPYPDPWRPHTGDAGTVLDDVILRLRDELSRENVACVILEPIQSDGGMVIPPDGFLSLVADACHEKSVPLIVDEVKVGLGRTGYLHAFAHEGIAPDIITLGKTLGGGLPLSAAVGPAWILDHGTASSLLTSAGNPICAAAGLAVLSVVRRDGLAQRSRVLGERLRAALKTGIADQGLSDRVGSIRGRGLTIGIDLVKNGDLSTPDPELARKTVYRAWELGAVVFYVADNVLEITPPLVMTDDEMNEGVEILLTAIAEAETVSNEQIRQFSGW